MRYCPNCGSSLPSDATHCPNCGAPASCGTAHSTVTPPPPSQPKPLATVPQGDSSAPGHNGPFYAAQSDVCPDGGLSTAQYFWTLVLFSIPVIGWVFLFYWGFGRHVTPARKRLARAYLLRSCLFLVSLVLLLVMLFVIFVSAVRQLIYEDYLSDYPGSMPGPDSYYDQFDPFFGEFGPYSDPYEWYDEYDAPDSHHPYTPFFPQQPSSPYGTPSDGWGHHSHRHTGNFCHR